MQIQDSDGSMDGPAKEGLADCSGHQLSGSKRMLRLEWIEKGVTSVVSMSTWADDLM
jgi:hypothetical protein